MKLMKKLQKRLALKLIFKFMKKSIANVNLRSTGFEHSRGRNKKRRGKDKSSWKKRKSRGEKNKHLSKSLLFSMTKLNEMTTVRTLMMSKNTRKEKFLKK